MMNRAPRLSLMQHFTVAALALTVGMGAAMGADAVVVPVLDAIYYTPVTAFAVNFGALFTATAGTAGYAGQAFVQYNKAHPRLQSWALPAQSWWDKKEGP